MGEQVTDEGVEDWNEEVITAAIAVVSLGSLAELCSRNFTAQKCLRGR